MGWCLKLPPCRPHEGSARFNVEFTSLGSPAWDGRPSQESRLLARALERNLRDSGMLDMEALCVAAGRKVRGSAPGVPG